MKKILTVFAFLSFLSVCVLATDHLIPRHEMHPHGEGSGGEGEPRHWFETVNPSTGEPQTICAYTWSVPCE